MYILSFIGVVALISWTGQFLMFMTGNDGVYCSDCSKNLSKNRLYGNR